MNSKQIRGLSVINIADGTQVGTVDQVFLDLAAKQVVGFSITNGVGPFGGARDNAPTVAASGVHSLGPDALTLDDVTAAHQSTPARVALAWLLAQPSVTAPIASATKAEQLHDILAATELKLTTADVQKLNDASAS